MLDTTVLNSYTVELSVVIKAGTKEDARELAVDIADTVLSVYDNNVLSATPRTVEATY